MGLAMPPALEKKTIGKMGLKGVPGLRIDPGQGGGRGDGGGVGGGGGFRQHFGGGAAGPPQQQVKQQTPRMAQPQQRRRWWAPKLSAIGCEIKKRVVLLWSR